MLYPKYKYLIAGLDIILILIAFAIAIKLRFPIGITDVINITDIDIALSIAAIFFLVIAHLFIFQSLNLYKLNIILNYFPQIYLILKGLVIGTIVIITVQFLIKYSMVFEGRLVFFYYALIASISLIVFRTIIFRNMYIFLVDRGLYSRNIAIIGTGQNAMSIAADLLTKPANVSNIV